MKKLVFLIATIICGFTAFAQQVNLNKTVSVDIPKDLQKITKEQALAHAGKKFNNNKMLSNFYATRDINNDHLYKIDDIVITLKAIDTIYKFKDERAVSLKKGLDEMAKGDPSYTSSLEKINNNAILTTYSEIGNVVYSYFYCFNAHNTRTMSGSLIYEKADKDKATAILNHILNSLKFKD